MPSCSIRNWRPCLNSRFLRPLHYSRYAEYALDVDSTLVTEPCSICSPPGLLNSNWRSRSSYKPYCTSSQSGRAERPTAPSFKISAMRSHAGARAGVTHVSRNKPMSGHPYRHSLTCGKRVASGLLRRSLIAHAVLTVAVPYLHGRLRTYGLSRSWPDVPSSDFRRRAWDVLLRLETLHATSALVGFVAFLWDGKCVCIHPRRSTMRLVHLGLLTAHRQVPNNSRPAARPETRPS